MQVYIIKHSHCENEPGNSKIKYNTEIHTDDDNPKEKRKYFYNRTHKII